MQIHLSLGFAEWLHEFWANMELIMGAGQSQGQAFDGTLEFHQRPVPVIVPVIDLDLSPYALVPKFWLDITLFRSISFRLLRCHRNR